MTSKEPEKDNKSAVSMSPEEFEFETRYVVLNFLGLVPAASSFSASRGSSEGRRSGHVHEPSATGNRKSKENGSDSGEWSSLHELPQMSLNDKITHHGPQRGGHIPLEQFKPTSMGDIRNDEQVSDDTDEFEGYDDDDTIYRPAGFKVQKAPTPSDDEISVPVVRSLEFEGEKTNTSHLDVKRSSNNSIKYHTQDIDDQYKVYTFTDDRGSAPFFPEGGSVPAELDHKINRKSPGTKYTPQITQDASASRRSDIPKPPSTNQDHTSKRSDIPRPADETVTSKRNNIPRPPVDLEEPVGPEQDGAIVSAGPPHQVNRDQGNGSHLEESVDSVDFARPFRRTLRPERPDTLDNLVKQGPTPFRYKKSKSPSKFNRGSLVRTPTYDSDKSDINREHSPLKRADSQRSSKPDYKSQISGSSRLSDLSDMESLMTSIRSQGSRTSYVEITHMPQVEVDAMVKTKMLPDNLKEGIEDELVDLDEQYKTKGSHEPMTPPVLSRSISLSPESKVAQYLSCIGDRVQEKYGESVNRAFERVLNNNRSDNISYDDVKSAAGEMTQNTSGWTKVALLLVLGKKLTWGLLSRDSDDNVVHNMSHYTTKLIEDHVADFIIKKGGWNSISELDEVESVVSSPRVLPEDDLEDLHTLQGCFHSISDPPPDAATADLPPSAPEEASPDLSSRSGAMVTSVHSEASTLVDGGAPDSNRTFNGGFSRDTSSETLPSSLFSPDSLTTQSPAGGSPSNRNHDPSNVAENNNYRVIKSVSNESNLARLPSSASQVSFKSTGFTVGNGEFSRTSSVEEEGGNVDMYEGMCAAPPTPCEDYPWNQENHRQVEGTMDLEIIRQELVLLRQMSNQYEQDSELERSRQFGIKVKLGLVGIAVVLVGLFIARRFMKPSS